MKHRIASKNILEAASRPGPDTGRCRCCRSSQLVALVCLVGWMGMTVPGHAQLAKDNPRLSNPRSSLDQPYEGPIFLAGHLAIGGGFSQDHGQLGYGGSVIFRPGSAVNFLDFLYELNTALVVQVDYQEVAPDGSVLSADLILRPYLKDRSENTTQRLLFLGLGLGATEVRMTRADGGDRVRDFSILVEGGQEWVFEGRYLVCVKGQVRYFTHPSLGYATYALAGSIGIPLPW